MILPEVIPPGKLAVGLPLFLEIVESHPFPAVFKVYSAVERYIFCVCKLVLSIAPVGDIVKTELESAPVVFALNDQPLV